jgi:isopentenyl-diphosphate delta-isomerase
MTAEQRTTVELPKDRVILVDENDDEIGACDKAMAHERSRLHRAFSIFLVDRQGRILLQRRSLEKYHSGGLWANSCCGHPRPREDTLSAATRRLREELGIASALERRFVARYRAQVGAGMEENEIAHVYFGALAAHPQPNPSEVMDTQLLGYVELIDWVRSDDASLAPWLTHYIHAHRDQIAQAITQAAPYAKV